MSHLLTIFATIPRHKCGKDVFFSKKVLLKLSSLMKFSQNFYAVKMIAVAPHHWFVQPSLALYIPNWCGLLLYPTAKAMREASSIG